MRGDWFLIYQDNNTPLNPYEFEERLRLKAKTQETAIIEAKEKWEQRLARGKWKLSPMPGFEKKEYPHWPRLRFEISLAD